MWFGLLYLFICTCLFVFGCCLLATLSFVCWFANWYSTFAIICPKYLPASIFVCLCMIKDPNTYYIWYVLRVFMCVYIHNHACRQTLKHTHIAATIHRCIHGYTLRYLHTNECTFLKLHISYKNQVPTSQSGFGNASVEENQAILGYH